MWFVLAFGGVMIGVLALATIVKYVEVRRAARWETVPGRVVSSQPVTRRVRTINTHAQAERGTDHELRNFAEVIYAYQVAGRSYRGQRVSIGEDLGNFRVAETVAQYPKGARVLVHYDPADPKRAVLERDPPPGIFGTMAAFIGLMAAVLVGAVTGFDLVVQALKANMADPARAIPVAALAGLAGFTLLLGRAIRHQAATAASWPWVEGVIESSDVESFRMHREVGSRSFSRGRFHRPHVVYRYQAGDVELRGTRLRYGARIYANFGGFARRDVDRYPVGRKVAVHVNPDNASDTVIETEAPSLELLWILAAVLLALAAWVAVR